MYVCIRQQLAHLHVAAESINMTVRCEHQSWRTLQQKDTQCTCFIPAHSPQVWLPGAFPRMLHHCSTLPGRRTRVLQLRDAACACIAWQCRYTAMCHHCRVATCSSSMEHAGILCWSLSKPHSVRRHVNMQTHVRHTGREPCVGHSTWSSCQQ